MTPEEKIEIAQIVAQVVTQAIPQAVQQVGQQIGQELSQLMAKFTQAQSAQTGTTTTGAGVFTRSEAGDIGGTETHEREVVSEASINYQNKKRTFDEYQDLGLVNAREARTFSNKILNDIAAHDNRVRVLAERVLANSITTDKMYDGRAGTAGDVATDALWNPVQQGAADTMTIKAVQLDDASVKAIAAAVAIAMADVLKKTA